MGRKIKYVCSECGSDEVQMEAHGYFNTEMQRIDWEWDFTYCPNCQDECGTVVLYLPPEVPENVKII